MKLLTEKQEICEALNFGKYPVLHLDLAKDKIKNMEGCYRGQLIKLDFDYRGEPACYCGNLSYYNDTNKLVITSGGTMLTVGLSYNDIIKMIDRANAPTVSSYQEIVIVIHNSDTKMSSAPILTKIGKITPTMQVMAVVEGNFKEVIDSINYWSLEHKVPQPMTKEDLDKLVKTSLATSEESTTITLDSFNERILPQSDRLSIFHDHLLRKIQG